MIKDKIFVYSDRLYSQKGGLDMKKILEKIILIGGWIVAAAQAIVNAM